MVRNVLIVDDDKHIQKLLLLYLEQAGFSVRVCSEGFSALEEIKRKPFDIVILDINMPYVNGMKVLKALRESEEASELPVLMLTSSSDVADIKKASQMGVTDYLVKPPKKKMLIERIERILGGRPQYEELYFDPGKKQSLGHFLNLIELESISRKGMVIRGQAKLPKEYEMIDLNLPVLNDLALNQKNFQLCDCQEIPEGGFHYFISFLSLSDSDRSKVENWILQESLERKGRAEKVS